MIVYLRLAVTHDGYSKRRIPPVHLCGFCYLIVKEPFPMQLRHQPVQADRHTGIPKHHKQFGKPVCCFQVRLYMHCRAASGIYTINIHTFRRIGNIYNRINSNNPEKCRHPRRESEYRNRHSRGQHFFDIFSRNQPGKTTPCLPGILCYNAQTTGEDAGWAV